MKKNKKSKPSNKDRWLLTYSDLITLLMIFFVIMFSMSSVDQSKYEQVINSLQGVFGGSIKSGSIVPIIIDGNNNNNKENNDELSDLKDKIDKYLEENDLDKVIATTEYKKGLVISIKDNILFDSGKTTLKSNVIDNLNQIGKLLKGFDAYVRVEGHTDNIPISNSSFKSNWELSVSRATQVLHFLVDNKYVPNNKISAVGYGQFRPIANNSTPNGRDKNRRVDILIVDPKYEEIEK